jgi:hypothetical protein
MLLPQRQPEISPMTTITRESWKDILRSAMAILRALDARGFARPDFAMGGGTVLMFRFAHRRPLSAETIARVRQFIRSESAA